MGLAGFARPLQWFKSQWLWLLLSIAAFWLLMRVQVEWLWFGQFNLQGMLLRRWLWQLGGLLLAILVVATCQLWQRNWIKLEGASNLGEPSLSLHGWRYGLGLLGCFVVVVGDLVLLSRLAWLACFKPFVLGHWWSEPFENIWAVVIPLSCVFISICVMLGNARGGP